MRARLILFFALLLTAAGLRAQDDDPRIPAVPYPPHLYNNLSAAFPNFLSPQDAARIEQKLKAFNDSTSNQIYVVIVDTLNGYEPVEYATQLGRKWGVGQKGKDNGVVVLIKPTGGAGMRKTFIGVGRGLEGAIPETRSIHVVDDVLIPHMKSGDNYGAIDEATTMLMQMANGEYHDPVTSKKGKPFRSIGIIIAIIIAIIYMATRGGRGGGGGYTIGRRGYFGGGFIGGGWGGGRSWGGGGGGWGGGGGGFGGGGGGSFGGGGSGGSW